MLNLDYNEVLQYWETLSLVEKEKLLNIYDLNIVEDFFYYIDLMNQMYHH